MSELQALACIVAVLYFVEGMTFRRQHGAFFALHQKPAHDQRVDEAAVIHLGGLNLYVYFFNPLKPWRGYALIAEETTSQSSKLRDAGTRLGVYRLHTRATSRCSILVSAAFLALIVSAASGHIVPILASAVMVVLFAALTTVMWSRAHGAIYPDLKADRITGAVSMLLYPLHATRACDSLARGLFANVDPVFARAALMSNEQFRLYAAKELRRSVYGGAGSDGKHVERVQVVIKAMGIAADELLAAPEQEQGALHYCPLCLNQYHRQTDDCPDCLVSVRAFEPN